MQTLHKKNLNRSFEGEIECKTGIDCRSTRGHGCEIEAGFQNSGCGDKGDRDDVENEDQASGAR